MSTGQDELVRLLVTCPDRPGIVAAISGFLHAEGANITDSAQHTTDPSNGIFLMRVEFTLSRFSVRRRVIEARFHDKVSEPFSINYRFSPMRRRPIAILVSRAEHCVLELLWRWRRDELSAEIALVISNHTDLEEITTSFGVPYHYVPVTDEGGMGACEAQMLALLRGRVELVVLARYMRIFSAEFLEQLGTPVINIHHSFLPAFPGRNPYQRALERGVKVIGATAHYVTEQLDAGPIIEQDVARVTHRHTLSDLEKIGREIERTVLARAVNLHLEDRILTHQQRTYVFE